MRNPIVASPSVGLKDQALVWFKGQWHMLMSQVSNGPKSEAKWSIATAASSDLLHWSQLRTWPPQQGVSGVASPDVTRAPGGRFVVTYQSDPGSTNGLPARLYYRTSWNLTTWSPARPLAHGLAPGRSDRMIDGALAWTPHGLVLAYKAGQATGPGASAHGGQAFHIGWSPTGSLNGPWRDLGEPDISVNGDTVENYELLVAGGKWRLVATSNTGDQPWMFTLSGDPSHPTSWLHWAQGYELSVPAQAFNTGSGLSSVTFEHANSAYLCDATSTTGYYYLLYAGSTELSAFGGWGHARIGMARSTDLVHWYAPPS